MVDAGLLALIGVACTVGFMAVSIPLTLVLLRPTRGRRSNG